MFTGAQVVSTKIGYGAFKKLVRNSEHTCMRLLIRGENHSKNGVGEFEVLKIFRIFQRLLSTDTVQDIQRSFKISQMFFGFIEISKILNFFRRRILIIFEIFKVFVYKMFLRFPDLFIDLQDFWNFLNSFEILQDFAF